MRIGSIIGAAVVLFSLPTTARAHGDEPIPSHAAAPTACEQGHWILSGASAQPNATGSAVLVPEWLPVLEKIAGCVAPPSGEFACLRIQGQFDEKLFSRAIVTAFGSTEAAQYARAHGRSGAVVAKLGEFGVPPAKLRELAPSREPSFRGVEIELVRDCLPRPAALSEEDRRAIAEAKALLAAPRAQPTIIREFAPAPAGPSPFFVEAGPGASVAVAQPTTVFSPSVRIGVGAKANKVFGRVGVGLATASRDAQGRAFEFQASAGYELLPWLDLGLSAGMRLGSAELGAPWLERSWSAGVEAIECPFTFGEKTRLCFQEAIRPFGALTRRARIQGGKLERIPPASDSLVRFELGAFLRRAL